MTMYRGWDLKPTRNGAWQAVRGGTAMAAKNESAAMMMVDAWEDRKPPAEPVTKPGVLAVMDRARMAFSGPQAAELYEARATVERLANAMQAERDAAAEVNTASASGYRPSVEGDAYRREERIRAASEALRTARAETDDALAAFRGEVA